MKHCNTLSTPQNNMAGSAGAAQAGSDAKPMDLIRAEYFEMPGLSLTLNQVERLWSLDQEMADTVLHELQRLSFLRRTDKGTYVRADLGNA